MAAGFGRRGRLGGVFGALAALALAGCAAPGPARLEPAAARPGETVRVTVPGVRAGARLWLEPAAGAGGPRFGNEGLGPGEGVNFGGQRRAAVEGDWLYVADWFAGLRIYSLRDPARPRLVTTFHTPGSAKGVAVRDGIAYVADDDRGLSVVDVRNRRRPRLLARLALPGLAYTPVPAGQRLYLAAHRAGLHVIDVTDPARPRLVATLDTPGKAWSVAVRGTLGVVADAEGGVLTLDLSDPAHPRLRGRYRHEGLDAEDVVLAGTLAYVGTYDDGVLVLDLADPARPRLRGRLAMPGPARGLALADGRLYVADWDAGLRVYDLADPAAPRLLGVLDTPGMAWGVALRGTSAYVLDWWAGMLAVDVGEPGRMRVTDGYPRGAEVRGLARSGRWLLAAAGHGGLLVFDVRNPLNPTWAGSMLAAAGVADVAAAGGRVWVALGGLGVGEVDLSDPYAPALRGWHPVGMPVRRVWSDGRWVAAGDPAAGLVVLRAGAADGPALAVAGPWRDAAVAAGVLYWIGADGRLQGRRLDGGPADADVPAAAGLVRLAAEGGLLCALAESAEVACWRRAAAGGWSPAGRLVVPGARALALAGPVLHVAGAGALVTAAVGADGLGPARRQPLAAAVDRLAADPEAVYGAPAPEAVAALRPLPDVSARAAGGVFRLTLPADLPPGRYLLRLADGRGAREVGTLRVAAGMGGPVRGAEGLRGRLPAR
ncbi:PQQ-binding-like beta-propeller repeat protein [Inmirania thermothiophila]|nr:PQQ-binding-like beta-propeller repeat protein [Inmirania thermothiophila]